MHYPQITLGILAGGQGRRAGGRDKGLLVYNGQPLAQRLSTMSKDFTCPPESIICCRRNAFFYRAYADKLVCDRQFDMGPLGGMLALLSAASHEDIVILPCDALGSMPKNWISSLLSASKDSESGAFITDQGIHTPCCLLRKAALTFIESELARSRPTLRGFYASAGLSSVPLTGAGRDWDRVETQELRPASE